MSQGHQSLRTVEDFERVRKVLQLLKQGFSKVASFRTTEGVGGEVSCEWLSLDVSQAVKERAAFDARSEGVESEGHSGMQGVFFGGVLELLLVDSRDASVGIMRTEGSSDQFY